MRRFGILAVIAAIALPSIVVAQATFPTIATGVKAPASVPLICDGNAKNCQPITPLLPLPTAGKQEVFVLASANVAGSDQSAAAPAGGGTFTAASATAAYGGSYAFTQICTGYGTVALQTLFAPTGVWLTLASYTTADTASHVVSLGSNAIVRVTLTGTTACNANLTRIPA